MTIPNRGDVLKRGAFCCASLLAITLWSPAARAQTCLSCGGGSYPPPSGSISPSAGAQSSQSVAVTLRWSDTNVGLDTATKHLTVSPASTQGTTSFQVLATSSTSGFITQAQYVVNLSLPVDGSDVTVTGYICNLDGSCSLQLSSTFHYAPPPPPAAGPVVVAPSSVARPRGEGLAEVFRIVSQNSAGTETYTLSGSCDAPVTVCAPSAGQITIGPGDTAVVAINYRLDAVGSMGSLGLTATRTSDGTSAFGSATVLAMVSAGPPGGAGDRADLTLQERSMCVTASLGAGAAYECGDLRLVAPLPSVKVLNGTRTPVLLYNSQHAKPYPVIAAHVVRDVSMPRPDSVGARLVVENVTVASRRWPGYPPGDTARIALGWDASGKQTGVYGYHFEVTAYYAGGTSDLIYARDGRIAVVNRGQAVSGSAFGNGWWLAGLERLIRVSDEEKLWVGGDGSTRLYKLGTDGVSWVGPLFDRTDTLRAGAADTLIRTLPGGAQVYFDSAGYHVRTVNPLGHQTRFRYSGSQLVRIVVPLQTDSVVYAFNYTGGAPTAAAGMLTEVVARGPRDLADSARVVRLALNGRDVTRIYEPQYRVNSPAGSALNTARPNVLFTTTTGRITARTNPVPATTYFRYDTAGLLASSIRAMAAGDSIRIGFRAAESQGLAGPVAQAAVYTRLDGPRTDVGDTTTFVLDRWGAPVRIVDAMGHATTIRRASTQLPAVVTSVVYPNGREVTAGYDDHGNVLSTTDWSHLSNGRYATTAYAYDLRWDHATRVTQPEGETSEMAYDSIGRLLYVQPGPDAARRVSFQYRTKSQWPAPALAASVTLPATSQNPAAVETYEYDALGNLSAVVSPRGSRREVLSDDAGRPVRARQQINAPGTGAAVYQTDSTVYDEVGRVARSFSVGPAMASTRLGRPGSTADTVVVVNTYDAANRLKSVSRISRPDPTTIDTVTTRFDYDDADRKVAEFAPDTTPGVLTDNPVDSTYYDPAGNVVRTRNRLGESVTFQYDTLNRLRRRFVPAVTRTGFLTSVGTTSWYFPFFRDNGTGALETAGSSTASFALRGDTSVFSYDEMGNLATAVNQDAVVDRAWFAYGALQSETQRIRSYVGQDTTTHTYTLQYGYDLDGRRTTLAAPMAAGTQTYAYDAGTGELREIRDVLGTAYTWRYDNRGQRLSFTRNQVTESYTYDNDGQLTQRYERSDLVGTLHSDLMSYDGRGKLTQVVTLQGDTVQNDYTGLGMLAGSYRIVRMVTKSEERYRNDALGNRYASRQNSTDGFRYTEAPDTTVSRYQRYTGRLRAATGNAFTDTSTYDVAGNRAAAVRQREVATPYSGTCSGTSWLTGCSASGIAGLLIEETFQYYGADGRARIADRRTCFHFDDTGGHCDTGRLPLGNERAAFEEYRYDALGRRVLVRSRQAYLCAQNCQNVVRRTVWDGDQVLLEIQAPGATGTPAATMEKDQGLAPVVDTTSLVLPKYLADSADVAPTDTVAQTPGGGGFHFGRVLYTHGPGIDAPLSLVRYEYSSLISRPQLVVPHNDWRGEYDVGSYRYGALAKPCVTINRSSNFRLIVPDGTSTNYPKAPSTLNTSWDHCMETEWPAPHVWLTRQTRNRTLTGPIGWMGTLIDGMRDNSGQMYMRNRYYDPASGRFTQEDPIGLAGGLNVYGFAAGDPVNYEDPYGLKSDTVPGMKAYLKGQGDMVKRLIATATAMGSSSKTLNVPVPWNQRFPVTLGDYSGTATTLGNVDAALEVNSTGNATASFTVQGGYVKLELEGQPTIDAESGGINFDTGEFFLHGRLNAAPFIKADITGNAIEGRMDVRLCWTRLHLGGCRTLHR